MAKNSTLTAAELSAFCGQVALMLGSGMIMYEGMEALAESYKDSPTGELYASVAAGVTETGSLYEALKADNRWPAYLVEMTAVGERTGRLEEVMKGLAAYYEREGRIRSAVRNAVTYPVVLGVMMLLIIAIMIIKVLPVFSSVLGNMGIDMTESGSRMMQLGTVVGWTVMIIVGICVLAVIACCILMTTKAGPAVMAGLMKVFPPVRKLTLKLASSRVASVLSMMLSGGFTMEEALEMVGSVLTDETAKKQVSTVKSDIENGVDFASALAKTNLFDALNLRMIRVGCEVGRQDEVMANIARSCEEDEGDGHLQSRIHH